MRSLIEAGIAILIVYLFVKTKEGETPQQALSDLFAPIAGSSGFVEAPGEASGDSELIGQNFYGTRPNSTQYTGQTGGCCGTKSGPPIPTPTLPQGSTGLVRPNPIVTGLVPVSPRILTNYVYGGGLS